MPAVEFIHREKFTIQLGKNLVRTAKYKEVFVVILVQGLMTQKEIERGDLSSRSGVSLTAIARFLNGEGELKASSLLKILSVLGVNVEAVVKRELAMALGILEEKVTGEDFGFLLDKVEPITRKMIADSLISNLKDESGPELKGRIERFKRYRDSIKTVGRVNC